MLPGDKWNVPVLSTSTLVFNEILTEVDKACNLKSKELIEKKIQRFKEITGQK